MSLLLVWLLPTTPPPTRGPDANDDPMPRALGRAYPAWLYDYQQLVRQLVAAYHADRQARSTQCLFVPVVVHVMHDGDDGNITDEQVADGIGLLNRIFQASHPDTAQVIAYFKPRIGNANLEFRLARLDPAGQPTSGITRHDTSLTRAADDPIKQLPGARWDPRRYLNVWVVIATAIGPAGYAYPPGVRDARDGVVIRHAYLGSIGTAPDTQSRRYTLAHEVGHYLGLRHVGGPGNVTGPGLNKCADDDGVADTPNTEGSVLGTCDLGLRACPGDPDSLANVQNIMDYSAGCRAMFTRGQVALMRAGLAGGFAGRAALVRAANLRRTGVLPETEMATLLAGAPANGHPRPPAPATGSGRRRAPYSTRRFTGALSGPGPSGPTSSTRTHASIPDGSVSTARPRVEAVQ